MRISKATKYGFGMILNVQFELWMQPKSRRVAGRESGRAQEPPLHPSAIL